MSSRNRYLTHEHRQAARALSRALAAMSGQFQAGINDVPVLLRTGDAQLRLESDVQTNYLSIVDPDQLEPVTAASAGDYLILAARVGVTRLLDNHRLGEPFPVLP